MVFGAVFTMVAGLLPEAADAMRRNILCSPRALPRQEHMALPLAVGVLPLFPFWDRADMSCYTWMNIEY